MSEVLGEARSKLEAVLTEVEKECKQLEQALLHLTGSTGSSPRKSPRKPPGDRSAARTRKRRKQARKGQRREEVLKAITEEPGTTAAKVAKKLDINPSQVSSIAKALLKDKLVAKKGPSYTAKPQAKAKSAAA